MNTLKLKSIFAMLICCLFVVAVNAQSADDLYYTPSTVDFTVEDNLVEETASADAVNDDTQFYGGDDYSDFDQRYEDDFYYQSRLRRFCNPYSGLSYYAPAYTNPYYYNNSPFAWSNNIYFQPFYGQNWWTSNRRFNNNNYFGSNFGFNNYNYVTYNTFNSTVFNSPYAFGGRSNVFNNGFSQVNPFYDPCSTVNNYVRNSIDNYNTRENSKPSANTRIERERPTSYRTDGKDNNRTRTSGVRAPSTTKNNDGFSRTNTTRNSSSTSPKPRYRSNENSTTKPKKEKRSNFFNSLKDKNNNSSKDSYRSNTSKNNTSKSYRSGSSNSRSFGSSSRSSSRSSGARSSKRGGRN